MWHCRRRKCVSWHQKLEKVIISTRSATRSRARFHTTSIGADWLKVGELQYQSLNNHLCQFLIGPSMQKPKPTTKKRLGQPPTIARNYNYNIKSQDTSQVLHKNNRHVTEQPKEEKTCIEKQPFHALCKTQHACLYKCCQQGNQPLIMSFI